MAMAEPNFGPIGDDPSDDLPRTFRREKEARERETREKAAATVRERHQPTPGPSLSATPDVYIEPAIASPDVGLSGISSVPFPAAVRRFDVPFLHLVTFFLKAVFAAIPALILLTAVLWLFGHMVQMFFPDLIKMKILIGFQG
jgi:hypothetical protein